MSRRMNRREFLKLAGGTAGAIALSACAPKATEAPAEQKPAQPAPPGEEVTLEFWTFNDYAVGKALELFETFIAEFEEANPGTKVNITGKPGEDIRTGLITGAGAGELPDVVQIQMGTGGDLIETGAIADVRTYWDEQSDEFRNQFNQDWMALLLKEGHCWGLPFTAYSTILYRNLNVLKDAGIDPDAGVADWEDFAAQAKTVKEMGPWGLAKILGSDWIHKHWYGGVTGADKSCIAPDGKSTTMEADSYATLFEYLVGLQPYTAEPFMYDTATTDLFVTNQMAFVSMGPWLAPTLEEAKAESGLEYDAVLIPGMTAQDKGGVKGGEFTPVMPGPNLEMAWKWSAYVSDAPQTSRFASELGRFLANDKALQDPAVQENWLVQLTAEAFTMAMAEGPFMLKVASGWGQPETDYGTLVADGSMEPAEAAEKMIQEINEILAEG
jgi:multiple sugar transport system substrate-binding protein